MIRTGSGVPFSVFSCAVLVPLCPESIKTLPCLPGQFDCREESVTRLDPESCNCEPPFFGWRSELPLKFGSHLVQTREEEEDFRPASEGGRIDGISVGGCGVVGGSVSFTVISFL